MRSRSRFKQQFAAYRAHGRIGEARDQFGDCVRFDKPVSYTHLDVYKRQGSGPDSSWCYAVGSYDCFNPPIPAGTPAQHTRILGQNYASCNAGGATNPKLYKSNLTQLFGGFSLAYAINLENTRYVDFNCIELTSHNGKCVTSGTCLLYTSRCV